jgi:hypothetical protein
MAFIRCREANAGAKTGTRGQVRSGDPVMPSFTIDFENDA